MEKHSQSKHVKVMKSCKKEAARAESRSTSGWLTPLLASGDDDQRPSQTTVIFL